LPGRINSLAQTLLNYTAPGVPDTYQGSELWDLTLVDPDNRAPVDYQLRQSMLSELQSGICVEEIMKRIDTGMPKLWLIHQVLQLRQRMPQSFSADAAYTPLTVEGPKKEHALAFLRADNIATVVPRWSLRAGGNWGSTTVDIPEGRWTNILTGDALGGGRARMQTLLQRFPVALFVQEKE
jgi:(1->4)-alpha-D-glucan 1-alpha-D-glucosylmutase